MPSDIFIEQFKKDSNMNKKINEIAEICGYDTTPENPTVVLSSGDLEYFARCLIKECMRICEHDNHYDASMLIKRTFDV